MTATRPVAFRVTGEQLADDRRRIGEILDQVDAWIAEGVLGALLDRVFSGSAAARGPG
jgi:hypothetical protein